MDLLRRGGYKVDGLGLPLWAELPEATRASARSWRRRERTETLPSARMEKAVSGDESARCWLVASDPHPKADFRTGTQTGSKACSTRASCSMFRGAPRPRRSTVTPWPCAAACTARLTTSNRHRPGTKPGRLVPSQRFSYARPRSPSALPRWSARVCTARSTTDVASSLNNLALLLTDQGKYARPGPFFRKALAMRAMAAVRPPRPGRQP